LRLAEIERSLRLKKEEMEIESIKQERIIAELETKQSEDMKRRLELETTMDMISSQEDSLLNQSRMIESAKNEIEQEKQRLAQEKRMSE